MATAQIVYAKVYGNPKPPKFDDPWDIVAIIGLVMIVVIAFLTSK